MAFGKYVETLNGRYYTTEDVGSTVDDMVVVKGATNHVVGLPIELGGSGDPSKATGLGVFQGMKAAVKHTLKVDSLAGITVAFQGFGKVARYIAPYLLAENARLIVADIDTNSLKYADELGCIIHDDPSTIYDVECEIFAPCAMGGSLNKTTIPRLRSKIVAGCANNQLQNTDDGFGLKDRGIVYIPDFVINAGGVINLSFEIGKPYRESAALERVSGIYDAVSSLLKIAYADHVSPIEHAESQAEKRINSVRESQ
jgi:leucine dehydrogenase